MAKVVGENSDNMSFIQGVQLILLITEDGVGKDSVDEFWNVQYVR